MEFWLSVLIFIILVVIVWWALARQAKEPDLHAGHHITENKADQH